MDFNLFIEELVMQMEFRMEEIGDLDPGNLSHTDVVTLASEAYANHTACLCLDCGEHTILKGEYYMVHNEIWNTVNRRDSGMLCIECLEDRLGRKLTKEDFTGAPINDAGYNTDSSDTLKDRLGIG